MIKSVIGSIAVAVILFAQNLGAAELTEQDAELVKEVFAVQSQALLALECSSKKNDNSCKNIQDLAKDIHKNANLIARAKLILDAAVDTIHQAIAKDEAKINELESIFYSQPKSVYHYQQIISFAKLQIASASQMTRKLLVIHPEIERANHNFVAIVKSMEAKNLPEAIETLRQNYNGVYLNHEKWQSLQRLIYMALGLKQTDGTYDKNLELLLSHASEGSVVYQIPASSEKINGMLPFFCEEDEKKNGLMPYCNRDVPTVRFNVELLKKLLGEKHGYAAQIVVEKAWSEKILFIEMLSGLIYAIKPDVPKKTIYISYYETHSCQNPNPNDFRRLIPGGFLCNDKPITTRHIASRKMIEKTLFDMLGVQDESLKLFAADPN